MCQLLYSGHNLYETNNPTTLLSDYTYLCIFKNRFIPTLKNYVNKTFLIKDSRILKNIDLVI